ncbi:hypothetical protein Dac01nite_07680 [Demequina activiva]|uniref:Signal transduction histidine kinase n=2 Tax=Demequina activiva TaxID=1582364 RepID=A0A919Q165_9MICO|nr:hypothetical protein Dac01nite_07680 [Demequina activiva]
MGSPPSPAPADNADVSSLLYLGSPAARLILALFVLSNAIFTVGTADVLSAPWQSYVAMLLVSAGGVLLLRPHPDPFPLRDTAAVLAVVVVSTALVATNLPGEGDLGRASWHLGSNTWLLFFLTLRRRGLYAWAGMAAMAAITIAAAASSGRGAVSGALMLNAHMGILVVATLFARTLRRTARRIASLERRSIAAAAQQARVETAEEIRRTRAAELAAAVVPLLERIANGAPASDEERQTYAVTEAALRDGVRGRSLMLPSVVEAAARARRRGVTVTILDDRGALPPDGDSVARVVAATVDALDAASDGTVTIRLVPAGRSVGLTVVATAGDQVRRTTLGPDGHELERSS